jgi:mRNA interferase MazF
VLKRGDIAIVDFKGSQGREQSGIRPALVLTSQAYHEVSSTAIVVPITTKPNPWPFKLELPAGGAIEGYLLVDQTKSVDRVARGFRVIDHVSKEFLDMVSLLLDRLIKEQA